MFTGREEGDIRDRAHAATLAAEAGRPLAVGRQVHGATVHTVTEGGTAEVVEADGQATDRIDVAPAVLVADCLPAAIGPGAGPCCYAVGDELRERFGTSESTLDLKEIARRRLNAAGIDHVEDAGVCT